MVFILVLAILRMGMVVTVTIVTSAVLPLLLSLILKLTVTVVTLAQRPLHKTEAHEEGKKQGLERKSCTKQKLITRVQLIIRVRTLNKTEAHDQG